MSDTKIGILFKMELLHKYFANQACVDFSIVPSLKTVGVLSGQQIIAKQYQNLLYAGVQLDAGGKPFPVPIEGMQLTFFLQLNNPLFFNYTNLPVTFPSGKIYYFSNRNNTISNSKKFLSADILAYDSSKTYNVGDVATDGSGVVYMAIHSSNSGSPSDLTHPDHWRQIDNNRYVTEQDALQWLPSKSTYTFTTNQPNAFVVVSAYNPVTDDYSTTALTRFITFDQPAPSFTLDLSPLLPGKYKLSVNSEEKFIYLNDELSNTKTFAVVDIFNEPLLPAGYGVIDGSNNLLSPTYSLSFLNRATIWKYVLASGLNGAISDVAGVFQFSSAAPTVFSLAPIPLSESPLNIKLTINSHDYTKIACATPKRFTNFTSGGDQYYCSEIFLNH